MERTVLKFADWRLVFVHLLADGVVIVRGFVYFRPDVLDGIVVDFGRSETSPRGTSSREAMWCSLSSVRELE